MLNQVLATRSLRQHGGLQLSSCVELVKTGEEDLLDVFLSILLSHQIAAKNLQPAFTLPDLFPEVGGAVSAVWVQGIARGRLD